MLNILIWILEYDPEPPSDEKPFLLLETSFPAAEAQVPVIQKKSLEEIATFM